MSKFVFLEPSKETDNKLRWVGTVQGARFELYVEKWRVPQPWPKRILVHVCEAPVHQEADLQATNNSSPLPLEHGITAIVEKAKRQPVNSVRFDPVGAKDDWEIGPPYIPYGLLPSPSVTTLKVQVWWDMSAGTWRKN